MIKISLNSDFGTLSNKRLHISSIIVSLAGGLRSCPPFGASLLALTLLKSADSRQLMFCYDLRKRSLTPKASTVTTSNDNMITIKEVVCIVLICDTQMLHHNTWMSKVNYLSTLSWGPVSPVGLCFGFMNYHASGRFVCNLNIFSIHRCGRLRVTNTPRPEEP